MEGGDCNMEKKIEIYESDIEDYLFNQLIRLGYVPEEAEIEDLAMLMFDYLVQIGAIDEDEITEEEN
jgi:hypothetical protein